MNYNENFSQENFNICLNHSDYDKQAIIDDLIINNKSLTPSKFEVTHTYVFHYIATKLIFMSNINKYSNFS